MTDKSPDASEVAEILSRSKTSGRRSWLKKLAVWLLLLAFCAAAFYWWQRDIPAATPQYTTQSIKRGDLRVIITATGNLAPVNQVEVGSELSGIVKNVEVDFNDLVRVGQVLARLDTSKLEAQLLQSNASLEAARAKVLQTSATVKETSQNLERLQSLLAMSQGKAVSKHDLDAARASLDRAKADLASAEAAVNQNKAVLKAIETDLAKAIIHSPINGVVLNRSVDPGQTVAASLQAPVLFSLAEDLAKMELHVDVDEADVGKVSAGQVATFMVDAFPERSYPARISQVRYASKTIGGVVTYETLLDVDNTDLSLRPGMTATANITVQEVHDALLVPNAALRFVPPARADSGNGNTRNGGSILTRLFPRPRHAAQNRKEIVDKGSKKAQRIWLLQAGKLVQLPVTTGATDGAFTEITGENLQPGQEIVVDSTAPKS